MLKKGYTKLSISILRFLNYNKIEDENGSYHVILNTADFLFSALYVGVSIWKLSSVTEVVLLMNLLTLLRLIVGNLKKSMYLRDSYEEKYLTRPGLAFKSAYDFKLIFELCVIAFSLVPFWVQGVVFEEHIIRGFAGVIILLGFLENIINILAELFKAKVEV